MNSRLWFAVAAVTSLLCGPTGVATSSSAEIPINAQSAAPEPAAVLQTWIEAQRPPQAIVARRDFGGLLGIPAIVPGLQRLVRAWPRRAVLQHDGDPDKACSYRCEP
jgi:hypothetical protein